MTAQQARRLGALIRSAREAKGVSVRELSTQMGLTHSWLGYFEAGRSLEPLPDRVAMLAEMLDIDPAEIDKVSGDYLAQSLPNVRTYFRSKGKATQAELDELEHVVDEVKAKYRSTGVDGSSTSPHRSRGAR
jgi:transcriptional regulator with XRE-family HTH domain